MNTTRFYILLLLVLTTAGRAVAQRVIGDLESNTDMSMSARGDTIGKHKEGKVPTEVRCWTIDEIYGNITPIHPDTLHHQYQNNSLTEGLNGQYNTLGNLGSPRQNRIFMDRDPMHNFIFLTPYDQFYTPTERFRHYNTKSPFMNLAYNWCGEKTTGYDNFSAVYTQNVGKRANFGAQYKYLYGQGYYNNQSTGYMNTSVWASYLGDKYNLHFYYTHNYMKGGENGGMTDERYITDPYSVEANMTTRDYPTHLSRTWNRQEQDVIFLNHHYNIGFYRTENDSDSINTKRYFVPVTKIFHTVKVSKFWHNYRAYRESNDYYHSHQYLFNDTINDHTTSFSVRNNVGLALCEGFQKWAAFGLNAYVGHEYRNYVQPDTVVGGFGSKPLGRYEKRKDSEYNLYVGGQLIRTQGSLIHYNVNAEFVFLGSDFGQLDLNGHGELNLPMFGDTTKVEVNAYIKNINPSYFFRHFHSTYAWWDQDTKKEWRQRIEGVLSNRRTGTRLRVGVENIENYTYFINDGEMRNSKLTNHIVGTQHTGNIQVISANLQQNLAFGPLHLDVDATYQFTSNKEVLPLPALSLYGNLYLDFRIAKVLHCELGADCKYFTEYYAQDYSPVVCNFTNQNPNRMVKVGNYPIASVYANFDLKRLRFYVQYYHVNQSDGRYFTVPFYPLNPGGIHFGLSWNFYD